MNMFQCSICLKRTLILTFLDVEMDRPVLTWARAGQKVISVDPIYQCTGEEIRARIDTTYSLIMEQLKSNIDDFIWEQIKSPEHLGQIRMAAMSQFLSDFDKGKKENRYLAYRLPELPFEDRFFDLALCSHFLFLYPNQLSINFIIESISEMIRVAREVRIFPLLKLNGQTYPRIGIVYDWIEQSDHRYKVEKVNYEFQRGGNQMLRIF